MLPLGLLKAAMDSPLLVELKSGETYNGLLVTCDCWMNIKLRNVVCTSSDGDGFLQIPECFIRGCMIKYLRIPDEIFDTVKANNANKTRAFADGQKTHDSRQGGYRGRGGSYNHQYSGDRTFNRGQSNFYGGK